MAIKTSCSIDGCEKPKRKRGWCNSHYMNWFRRGDPSKFAPRPTPEERFWSKVNKTESCWIWMGVTNDSGYGLHSVNKVHVRAHRFSWETLVGLIPEGMQIDHQCRKRDCVNPSHLRLATNKQNQEHITKRSNNSSGYRGVTFDKRKNKWSVMVMHEGRNHFGGNFDDVHEAGEAARVLRLELFTHNDLDRIAS